MILACHHISKSFIEVPILRDITFHLEKGEKAAIVGVNGAGKSTLLKIIMGEENADDGTVSFTRGTSIGYLAQNQNLQSENTIYQEMLQVRPDIIAMEQKIASDESLMTKLSGDELNNLVLEYNDLLHRYQLENGYAYKGEITGILRGLGFTDAEFSQKISTLSGGQKTRVALAKLMLRQPDLILLDEPTNHLDIDSIRWLETYLSNYRGTVLIVSHDRYFLDKIVTHIIEIENTHATEFSGNYSFYAEQKKALRQQQWHHYLTNQQEIKHQEEVIARLRQFNLEKSIKRAESHEKMLERMEHVEKPVELRDDMRLTLRPCIKSGRDVMQVRHLTMSFDHKHLFTDISFDLLRGEHVAIIGNNGTGKTTMLKIINGLLQPEDGNIHLGTNVHIGYYDQEHHVLHDDKTLFEEISDEHPSMTNTEIRNLLASFLFTGDDVFKLIRDLSGGEKGRVSLAKLMLSEANFLILDEPTNHLDMVSKEILENALNSYEGTILYVSHDRYFINHTASRILELKDQMLLNYPGNNAESTPERYIGNYDFYLEKKPQIEAALMQDEIKRMQDDHVPADRMPAYTGTTVTDGNNAVHPRSQKASAGQAGASEYASDNDVRNGYVNPAPDISTNDQNTKTLSGRAAWEQQKAARAAQRKLENQLKKCESRIDELENDNQSINDQLQDPSIGTDLEKLSELSKRHQQNDEELQKLYDEWEELQETQE